MLPAGQLHGATASTTRRSSSRRRSRSARWWTSGRSCSTPSAACCARAACASRTRSRAPTSLRVREPRRPHPDRDLRRTGPIEHDYAGNLADVCPVGALLSNDFRFKMRVWFLKEHESVCPGCSTGCNIYVDQRDGEVQRLRPRRNADVNKSWMCDPGRALYKEIGVTDARLGRARASGAARLGGRRPSPRPSTAWPRRSRRPGAGVGLPGHAAGHERGPLRLQGAGRGRGRQARLPGRRPAAQAARARSTTCCSAPTATRTRRAASTWAWAATASTRS